MCFNKILLFGTILDKFDLRTRNSGLSLVELFPCRAHFDLVIILHHRVIWHSDINWVLSVGWASFFVFCAVDAFITLISITKPFSLWLSNTLCPHDAIINSTVLILDSLRVLSWRMRFRCLQAVNLVDVLLRVKALCLHFWTLVILNF